MTEQACGNKQKNQLALTIRVMWAKMIRVLPSIPNCRFPNRGPVAQLGARFHGMEEVVGSIPTRSTNSLNDLDRAGAFSVAICVAVCVVTLRSGAYGKGFHRVALGFRTHMAVSLQHATADVTCNCHDCGVRRTVRIILSTELSILPFQNARRSDSRRNTPAAGCSWSGS